MGTRLVFAIRILLEDVTEQTSLERAFHGWGAEKMKSSYVFFVFFLFGFLPSIDLE